MAAEPLHVVIVGAGIGGLTAAIALKQVGHKVTLLEKSKFANEVGAALAISPNGSLVLSSLGISLEKIGGRLFCQWESVHGETYELISKVTFDANEQGSKRYGENGVWAVHRVDLHSELARLALDESGPGTVQLRLGTGVQSVDAQGGKITLLNGEELVGDVVVGADGLRSVVRNCVYLDGESPEEVADSGSSTFRFLIDTDQVMKDEVVRPYLEEKMKMPGSTISVDTKAKDGHTERHFVWYDCRGGAVQNFVGLHPTRSDLENSPEGMKAAMLKEFGHFDQKVVRCIQMAQDVKVWPLYVHAPLKRLTYGKVVLIGDAAHPMLPYGGQAGNQAIEDGGALGVLLTKPCSKDVVLQRLSAYDKLRRNRVSAVQILSSTLVGRELEVKDQVKKYLADDEKPPENMQERLDHHYFYDVLKAARQELSSVTAVH